MKTEERVSLQDAAEALGISERTARRWVKSGKLKAYKPGLRYLIPATAIEELLEGAEAPKVLLPFDVLEVTREVVQEAKPQTPKELREALDAEYVKRLEGWSLEELLHTEDLLLEEFNELVSAIPGPGDRRLEDPDKYRRWARVRDEMWAVVVARIARGVPYRDERQEQPEDK